MAGRQASGSSSSRVDLTARLPACLSQREQVRRLERELHGFLQKKYDYMQQQQQQQQPGGAGLAGPGGALLTPSGASSMGGGGLLMKGPGGQGSSRGGGGGPMAGLIREGSQGSAR